MKNCLQPKSLVRSLIIDIEAAYINIDGLIYHSAIFMWSAIALVKYANRIQRTFGIAAKNLIAI